MALVDERVQAGHHFVWTLLTRHKRLVFDHPGCRFDQIVTGICESANSHQSADRLVSPVGHLALNRCVAVLFGAGEMPSLERCDVFLFRFGFMSVPRRSASAGGLLAINVAVGCQKPDSGDGSFTNLTTVTFGNACARV